MNGGMIAELTLPRVLFVPKPKRSPLTRAECLALATDAHRLPEGTIGRQYQVVLSTLAMEWFLALNSRERGAIVEAGLRVKAIEVNQTTKEQ